MPTLKVDNINIRYKKKLALKSVTLEADAGQILGLIGADGAGKSSLMHAISGILRFRGDISFEGHLFHNPSEAEPVKKDIGLMPQGLGLILYPTLSVGEHLDFFADIRGIKKSPDFKFYKNRLLHMAGLERFIDREAGHLSGGMMQKLALICTLLHKPRLLLLDEPTTGVDPLSRLELWEIVKMMVVQEESTCVVSTAYMGEVQKMDRVALFEDGSIIARGSVESLLEGVKENVYQESKETIDDAISIGGYTYSYKSLPLSHKEPTLEALFFLSYLKTQGVFPEISLAERNPTEDNEVVMQAINVTKRFGKFIANDSISIDLKRGEILGLLGANGAGKTTFMKIMLGLLSYEEGDLQLLGRKINNAGDRQDLKGKIGYVSQHFALYSQLTVKENLLYFAHMHGIGTTDAHRIMRQYVHTLGLEPYLNEFPSSLPMGINQRLSMAAALLHKPVVLFLDEPTSGVDVLARAIFWKILKELKNKWHISIMITTHYMQEAEYCDRIVLLKDGKKIADANISELCRQYNTNDFEHIFLELYRQ